MKRKPLFPQISGIMHGGDYNPEQWLDRPDILEEDIRLMKKAGMTSATLGVFSWSVYEPREGEYHFDWLIEIMDRLYENGIYTILSTPSGGKPVWLAKKYQEVLRVGKDGRREHQGIRENHCMTSPIYRKKVHAVLEQLVARVKNHPG
ncbi:MAG: beta-galactosidase, partial [Lachnospiraceae bacterium]|nr:beta-galactosidase [Lachnospiraceae bacterium]